MPTVIGTSTNGASTGPFNGRRMDRNQDGTLWTFVGSGANHVPNYSKDDGATWTATTGASIIEMGTPPSYSLFIDQDDYAHVVWKQVGGIAGRINAIIYYMRGTPDAGRTAWTWGTAKALTASVSFDYPDVVACRNAGTSGWDAFVVMSYANSNPVNNAGYVRIPITSAGVLGTASFDGLSHNGYDGNVGDLSGNHSLNVHTYPSIDFNHTGDGKTVQGGTPHLYVGWSAGATGSGRGVRFRKAVYSSGWTWGTQREIDNTRSAVSGVSIYWLVTHFDGTRVTLTGQLGGSNIDVMLYERDAADTTTTTTILLAAVTGSTRLDTGSATYDSDENVYIFGSDVTGGSGTRKVNYRKWTRSGASLGAITTFDTTGSDNPRISARRGDLGSSIDWVWTDGTASPYSVTFDRISLNAAPNAPSLISPANASAAPIADGYAFDWTFSDPDAGDTQSSWSMRRKISGAADYEYYNVGSGAWQATEVFNASVTDGYTFPAGKWTNATIYNWSVATKDNAGLAGAYAADFTVTAGQAPVVTVTAPVGSVTTSSRPNVDWSYSDVEGDLQASYHVKIFDAATYGGGGFDPTTSTPVVNSGEVASITQRTWTPTADLLNGTSYRAYVRATQTGGQYSAWSYSGFTLSLTTPNAPTLTVAYEESNNRVALTIQGNDTGPTFTYANTTFSVEFSDDGGLSWEGVRGVTSIAPDVSDAAVEYDYEILVGVARQYRAITRASI